MANDIIQLASDGTGKRVDNESLTVAGLTVYRQRIQVAGTTDVGIASVLNAAPTTEYGLVTRNIPSGTQPISAASLPLPSGAALDATLTGGTQRAIAVTAISGGATPFKLVSAASTNATSVKASAGQVYAIWATNVNAAMRYLKLFNKASAPTVGTDTPVFICGLPGNAAGAGGSIAIPPGIEFTTGIALALTTGIADADTGAVAASEIAVSLAYK